MVNARLQLFIPCSYSWGMTGQDQHFPPQPDPPRIPGLRERKKKETRAALHRSALELTLEQGPQALTVDEIASRTGVSTRTFFNYYPAKEAALLGLPGDLTAQLETALRARPATEAPLDTARAVTRPYLEGLRPDTEVQVLRAQVFAAHPELGASMLRAVADLERTFARVALDRLTGAEGGGAGAPGNGSPPGAGASPTPEQRIYAWMVGAAAVGSVRAAFAARPGETPDPARIAQDFDVAFARVAEGLRHDVPWSTHVR